MFDLVGIGEVLIDFTPAGVNASGALFQQNLGGGVTNMVCAAAKLGWRSGFIGKVGDDGFGSFCARTMQSIGVDISGLRFSEEQSTTLAFVHLSESGDRSFTFYRKHSADVSLEAAEVDLEMAGNTRMLHFGGVSLTDEPARSATMHAVRRAKASGAMVSFDPNLRLNLWNSPEEAKTVLLDALPLADVIKLSEEEMLLLFGTDDPAALCDIQKHTNAKLLIVTLAEKGAVAAVNGRLFRSQAYDVGTVDTTGAGDCFLAGVLHNLLKLDKPVEELTDGEMSRMLAFANAAGSLVCAKMGGVTALPSLAEVEDCVVHGKRLA